MFHALADSTRRDIVRHVLTGTASVSDLARRYPMSFAAVQKHVAVLEDAGLVRKSRHGRAVMVQADITCVRRVADVLDQLETIWRGRLDRIGDLLAEPTRNTGRKHTP